VAPEAQHSASMLHASGRLTGFWLRADGGKRQELIDEARRYAEAQHSSASEAAILRQALDLLAS
jgi:hypothetical protein